MSNLSRTLNSRLTFSCCLLFDDRPFLPASFGPLACPRSWTRTTTWRFRKIDTGISNANLYFFSWGAFVMSFYVFFGYLTKGLKLGGDQLFSWAGITMTSFVVMVSAVRQYDDWNCDDDANSPEDKCKRLKLAVSVGTISAFIGLVWSFTAQCFKGKVGNMLETGLSWLVFVLYIFGIIYITFGGHKAPARELGNLYL